jgi:predicted DNA-binding transcriptional regulator YafY
MVTVDARGLRWGVERRLEFVEFRLFWEGGVNRSNIVDEFGVSVPQASKDLALYQEQAPDNIVYDRSEKRYFASDAFCPKFIELDAAAYLDRLAATPSTDAKPACSSHGTLVADRLPFPQRRIPSNTLRSLLAAVRGNRSIEIFYQSMSEARPEAVWRRVSPHAFASDGLRWHTRAYCHIDHTFKDFILSRCLDCRDLGEEVDNVPGSDYLWSAHFQVVLIPNPKLTQSRRHVVAQDFAMVGGRVVVPVRRAMLYYFCKRLRLDLASSDARETPVVVANREEFDCALSEATR